MNTQFFYNLNEVLYKIVDLNSIDLGKMVNVYGGQRTCFLEAGMEIKIENGEIVDCNGSPTHYIERCKGNLSNTVLELELLNHEAGEIEIYKLK